MARQKARVKRVWAILRFFTQFGFIVFTYLDMLIIVRVSHKINDPVSSHSQSETGNEF
ncbi:MAG: hypothetical protein HEQ13_08810 [Dolichospermum sp. DEX189]|nr:hypothetical protein [Dolichospermum sp. DEX189]